MTRLRASVGRTAAWAALAVILGVAYDLRIGGIRWALHRHPDEIRVARLCRYHDRYGELHKAYAGGFFTLIRPVRLLAHAVAAAPRPAMATDPREPLPVTDGDIVLARHFNVGLGMLTVLFVFAVGSRVTGSAAGGLIAAAVMALAPAHIEHCHYGETDVAMVWTLTAALALWARHADRRDGGSYLAACVVSGFAAGTGYPLVSLAALPMVFALLSPTRRIGILYWLQPASWMAAGTGCFAVGFLVGNPNALHTGSFLVSLATEGARVYQEQSRVMGEAGLGLSSRLSAHARTWIEQAGLLGWSWAGLAMIGTVLAWEKRWRRYWPITILFPTLYGVCFLGVAPCARAQEFLNFIPAIAVLASFPLIRMWQVRGGRFVIPARALAILALSLGLIAEARRGACMTSLFEFEDTRDLAWRWLERHGPSLSRVGFEKYTGPVAQDTSAEVGRVRQVETQGWNALRASGCEFVVRSPDPRAGGVFNPCTVTRFPACRDAFDEFVADAERLRVWAPLPPDSVKATFCSPEIELWGLRKDVRLRDLPIELPRPSRISLSGKECFFPVGCGLGSACAIEVGRGMRKIVVGGGGRRSPVYVVATSGAEPVRLRLKGCGRVRTVDLWSNDVQVVSFPRPAWLPRFRKYEQIVAEPVPTGAGERRDCFLRLAFSPEEAAQICVQRRREGRAVEFLDMGEVAMRRPALAYRVALRTEAWDLAARLQSVAEGLRAAMDAALTNEVLRLRVGGVDGGCYDEFARLRFAGDWEETEAAVAGVRTGESPRSGRYRKTLRFPALIPAGRFSLRLTLDIFDPGIDGVLSFVNSDGVSVALADRQDVKEGRLTVTVPLIGGQEERLALFLESETPFACRLTEAELTWSLRDALAAAHRDLRSSLAWHRKKETVR